MNYRNQEKQTKQSESSVKPEKETVVESFSFGGNMLDTKIQLRIVIEKKEKEGFSYHSAFNISHNEKLLFFQR